MVLKNRMVVDMIFSEPQPENYERIKTPEEFAQDMMEFISDQYSDIGSMAYSIIHVDQNERSLKQFFEEQKYKDSLEFKITSRIATLETEIKQCYEVAEICQATNCEASYWCWISKANTLRQMSEELKQMIKV